LYPAGIVVTKNKMYRWGRGRERERSEGERKERSTKILGKFVGDCIAAV
jgi:hypothetical protein